MMKLRVNATGITTLMKRILPSNVIGVVNINDYPSHNVSGNKIGSLRSIIGYMRHTVSRTRLVTSYRVSSMCLTLSNGRVDYRGRVNVIPVSRRRIARRSIRGIIRATGSIHIHSRRHILRIVPRRCTVSCRRKVGGPMKLSNIEVRTGIRLVAYRGSVTGGVIGTIRHYKLGISRLVFTKLTSDCSMLARSRHRLNIYIISVNNNAVSVTICANKTLHRAGMVPCTNGIIADSVTCTFNAPPDSTRTVGIHRNYTLNSVIKGSRDIRIPDMNNHPPQDLRHRALTRIVRPHCARLLGLIGRRVLRLRRGLHRRKIGRRLTTNVMLANNTTRVRNLTTYTRHIFRARIHVNTPLGVANLASCTRRPCCSATIKLLRCKGRSRLGNRTRMRGHIATSINS